MDFEPYFKYVGMVITGIGSISGAIWAFRKWWVRDEHFPRVAFDLKVNLIDRVESQQIMEVVAVLENKGVVPLKICDFTCEIRGIYEGEVLEMGDKSIRNQLNFKNQIQTGLFVPADWAFSFVYPTIKTDYNYVTMIPINIKYALVKSSFNYYRRFNFFGNKRSDHATVVLKIPNNSMQPSTNASAD